MEIKEKTSKELRLPAAPAPAVAALRNGHFGAIWAVCAVNLAELKNHGE